LEAEGLEFDIVPTSLGMVTSRDLGDKGQPIPSTPFAVEGPPEVVKGRLGELPALCFKRLASGDCNILVLELCCEGDSTLGRSVPNEAALLRITSDIDILNKDTQSLISSVIGFAGRLEVYLHAWVSIPFTAGCRWKASNEAHGVYTGDLEKTELLIDVVIGIFGQVTKNQGGFSWEGPSTNALWNNRSVQKLVSDHGAECRVVSHATVGGKLTQGGEEVAVKK
jgi:hypothetical protein